MEIIRPSFALLIFFIFYHIKFTIAPPPGLRDGQRWVADPNCPQGGVYKIDNGATRCHCWGHQGYICEPDFQSQVNPGGDRNGRQNSGGNTGNGNGCPPSVRVCIININSNQNENRNQNQNKNGNSNGANQYDNYDQ